nr:DUF559 domain-containing protein [Corynebacterium alimapuense]
MDRGIYTTVKPDGRLLAEALQVSRPALVLSGLSAYQVYSNRQLSVPLTGVVPRGLSAASTRFVEIREVAATPANEIAGLRVTLPVKAGIDLARRNWSKAIQLLEAQYSGRGGKGLLNEHLAEIGRIPQIGRELIAKAAIGSDSLTERDLFRVLRYRGLSVEQNVKVGHFWWDGVFRKEKVLVEIDGSSYHSGEARSTFIKDRWKRNQAMRLGYVVLTYTQVCIDEHVDMVVEQVSDTVAWRLSHNNRANRLPAPLTWENDPVWQWHDWWRPPAELQYL